MNEVELALKACVEATGEDLDGNNNDITWLVRCGAETVKDVVGEIFTLEEQVETLQKEHEIMKEALEGIVEVTKKFAYNVDVFHMGKDAQNALKQLEVK